MADVTFELEGLQGTIPAIDTLNLDEAITLHRYSGLTIDQIEDVEGLNPGLLAALLHIGIRRANPELKETQVTALVREANLLDLLSVLGARMEEVDESPPDLPPGSEERTSGSGRSSGDGSTAGSEDPPESDVSPRASGIPSSDTSAESPSVRLAS